MGTNPHFQTQQQEILKKILLTLIAIKEGDLNTNMQDLSKQISRLDPKTLYAIKCNTHSTELLLIFDCQKFTIIIRDILKRSLVMAQTRDNDIKKLKEFVDEVNRSRLLGQLQMYLPGDKPYQNKVDEIAEVYKELTDELKKNPVSINVDNAKASFMTILNEFRELKNLDTGNDTQKSKQKNVRSLIFSTNPPAGNVSSFESLLTKYATDLNIEPSHAPKPGGFRG